MAVRHGKLIGRLITRERNKQNEGKNSRVKEAVIPW
jgi:hypothetical protein